MTSALTLADLTARTGLDVFDYLEQEMTIPVVAGMQAQGDLLVIPFALVAHAITIWREPWSWQDVPLSGIELLRSAAGGNPHSLVADPGICRWIGQVQDTTNLALGVLETTDVAYLIHPEHGATGIAPGRYVVRRQRERGQARLWQGGRMSMNYYVAD